MSPLLVAERKKSMKKQQTSNEIELEKKLAAMTAKNAELQNELQDALAMLALSSTHPKRRASDLRSKSSDTIGIARASKNSSFLSVVASGSGSKTANPSLL